MTVLILAKGSGSMRYPLRLPASSTDFKKAYAEINSTKQKGIVHITEAVSPIWNLGSYLTHEDITDPDVREKLNTLAEKIDALADTDQRMMACVLDARSINGLDDVLSAADSLGEYIYHPQITTERE